MAKLTTLQKAQALVDAGVENTLTEAAFALVDMGEASYGWANRVAEKEAQAAKVAAIRAGTVCGTCADEGETACNCWAEVTG